MSAVFLLSFSFCRASLSCLSCSNMAHIIVNRLSRLENPVAIWASSSIIGSSCVLIVVISCSTFPSLVSMSLGMPWLVAARRSSSIWALRSSISCLVGASSLVWCLGICCCAVGLGELLWSLPASVTDILFTYANFIISCLLAKMGHAAVPASWSFPSHVGHFGGLVHCWSSSWAQAQVLHT